MDCAQGLPKWLSKTSTYHAGDRRDRDLTPASGRSPGGEMATHSSVLAWKIPWTEELGGLQSTLSLFSCQFVSTSFATLWTAAHQAPLSKRFPRHYPGNSGVVCHFLLQGVFSTQGLNPSQNLHCRQILYHWVTKEVPKEKKSGFAVLCLSSCTSFDSTCEFLGTIKCSAQGTSLVVQWLPIHLAMQETQVRSLVVELRSHMPVSS